MRSLPLRHVALLFVVLLLAGSILACGIGGGPSKPTITITAPTSDAQFEEGEEVNVLSSANDAKGITRVELYVDGALYRTDSSPSAAGEKSLAMVQTWTATDPGRHTLSVTAYNVDGAASDPWAVTIEVVEEGGAVATPTPTTSTAPPPAATNTTAPPPPPTPTQATGPSDAPSITYFRANGSEGSITVDAGTTVTLSWEWERVEEGFLDPGNMPMACPTMPCTYDVSPDATTTYTLRAVNSLGTIEAHVTVQIEEEEPLPDLMLEQLSVVPSTVVEGGSVQATIDVMNIGDAPSGPYTVVWRYGPAGPDYCQWDKSSLPPMNGGTVSCTVEMYESYTTAAEVDWEDNVEEGDEDNNRLEFFVQVEPSAGLPDLYISEIRLQPTSPIQGAEAIVGVRIHNGGTVEANNFNVIWESREPTGGCDWRVTSPLGPGAARWEQCRYTYTGRGHFNTYAMVDSDGEVEESDDDNNDFYHEIDVLHP